MRICGMLQEEGAFLGHGAEMTALFQSVTVGYKSYALICAVSQRPVEQ